VLVNNAGVALGGTFKQVPPENFEWMFGINFWGVVHMTRAFLPVLRRAGTAQIVNLSSIFGIVAPAGQVAYSASKFAVRGFSEALRHELEGSPIGVTVVHPGGVRTSVDASARRTGLSGAEADRQRYNLDQAPATRAGGRCGADRARHPAAGEARPGWPRRPAGRVAPAPVSGWLLAAAGQVHRAQIANPIEERGLRTTGRRCPPAECQVGEAATSRPCPARDVAHSK